MIEIVERRPEGHREIRASGPPTDAKPSTRAAVGCDAAHPAIPQLPDAGTSYVENGGFGGARVRPLA